MEAMRAVRDDGRDLVAVECIDGILRHDLVEIFVPHTTGGVAVTRLLLTEDGAVDVARLHDLRERDRDLPGAVVEGAHAPYPEEDVGALAALVQLRHRPDLHPLRPIGAIACV